ncbi:MAG TPA: 3-isopropylmalate dehydrogenase [Pyrinomonadaceae bacterium]|jgi:3-isopropylmalate dehydrogenase|nr:3-isopropylmalate dehydrogenase [Pyrinomonadaceae bacterium]
MRLNITTLPGDGVGPEVTAEAVRVLRTVADAYGHEFNFDEHPVGGAGLELTGSPLPRATLDACLASDAVLLGAVGAPKYDGLAGDSRPEAGLLALRHAAGAFANLRPVVCQEATADCSPLRAEVVRGADVLIVRELTGGLYFGEPRGTEGEGASAFNTMRYTAREVERVARVGFEAARARRGKVTSVDKANVLETSRLWREVVSRVARDYTEVSVEHVYVDACAMHLMTNPRRFDVILTENLFGDILSDEAAVIAGSLGMLASASVGGHVDIYEPVHGSAPDIAGRGRANPLGAIASAAMLLRHTARLEREAQDVESAIRGVLEAGYRTADLRGGSSPRIVGTAEMGALVSDAVAELADMRHAYHAV